MGCLCYCKGVFDVHATIQVWLFQVTTVSWEHRSSLPPVVHRWSQTGKTLGDGPLEFDYSRPRWRGLFNHSHFITRREDCACHQHYTVQLHVLQTAKFHLEDREARIFYFLKLRNLAVEGIVQYNSSNSPSDEIITLFIARSIPLSFFTAFESGLYHVLLAFTVGRSSFRKWLVLTLPIQTKNFTLHSAFAIQW